MDGASNIKESADTQQPINTEEEVDLSIYRSYCAMRHFMEAVSFCTKTGDWEVLLPGKHHGSSIPRTATDVPFPQPTDATKSEASESSNSTQQLESLQLMYNEHVMEHLKQGKQYIQQVFPLTQRLEVLENIFSLLFLTHEAVYGSSQVEHSDSDEGAESVCDVGGNAVKTPTPTSATPSESTGAQACAASELPSMDSWVPLASNNTQDASSVSDTEAQVPKSRVEASGTLFGRCSIGKADLKPAQSGTERKRSHRVSCAKSTSSNTSVGNGACPRFVCNEYVVRDILLTLKECLSELNALKDSMHGRQLVQVTGDHRPPDLLPHLEDALQGNMQCSIDDQQLQQRSSQLMQYVSEALWRLQLVTPDWVPQLMGRLVGDVTKLDYNLSSDEDLGMTNFHNHVTLHVQLGRGFFSGY